VAIIKPPKVTAKVEGMKELRAALLELGKATQTRVLKRTLEKAADPILSDAIANVPRDTNVTAESLEVSTKLTPRQRRLAGRAAKRQADGSFRSAKSKGVEVHIGPSAEAGRQAPAPAGLMQEFGTAQHPPQPWLRPAWDGNKGKALAIIGDELGKEIAKAARRKKARRVT
jgi:HK97 gp10 family phage protein